ncbi:MAG: type II toxin-antitoxin system HicA family toxin [Lachnospiraceae bacterium]|nr:type II toxin-antitoxin system HicA family toxin [Lachnospiraceae bacterium]
MKTSELTKILRKSGCFIVRQGSNHTVWYSPNSGTQFAVPRHKGEIKTGTVKSILKDAGIQ